MLNSNLSLDEKRKIARKVGADARTYYPEEPQEQEE